MSEFVWLIEAPGPQYLRTRNIGHYPDFAWTNDASKAIRLYSKEQADGLMMAIRPLVPALFAFELTLGNAQVREHAWMDTAP